MAILTCKIMVGALGYWDRTAVQSNPLPETTTTSIQPMQTTERMNRVDDGEGKGRQDASATTKNHMSRRTWSCWNHDQVILFFAVSLCLLPVPMHLAKIVSTCGDSDARSISQKRLLSFLSGDSLLPLQRGATPSLHLPIQSCVPSPPTGTWTSSHCRDSWIGGALGMPRGSAASVRHRARKIPRARRRRVRPCLTKPCSQRK